ncbi:SRPBCC domain-containing protein [Granulicoccus sp. GXG6511]|uniref:SRPBCC domain-containing protein n=1 Tax=Granulicoccus sp. GXG6511 TaxID=3381351 RepID=UPI003D7DD117
MATETTGTEDTTLTDSVRVTRTLPQSINRVWDSLMAPEGASALLGEGGELGNKGDGWQATDGSYGVTRSFHPLEQIRFSWHANEDAPATLVDLHMRSLGDDSTELELVHENLPGDVDREWLAQHWDAALTRIEEQAN